MSPRLAQCPWCGSDALPATRDPVRPDEQPTHHIRCRACHATGPRKDNREAARDAWNASPVSHTSQNDAQVSREPVAWRYRTRADQPWQLYEHEPVLGYAYCEPLYTSPHSRDIPEGWVLTPREPTEEMLLAACAKAAEEQCRPIPIRKQDAGELYDAMISAAPPAPETLK